MVTDRQELLRTMMDELEEKSARYATLLAGLDSAASGARAGRGAGRKKGGPGVTATRVPASRRAEKTATR